MSDCNHNLIMDILYYLLRHARFNLTLFKASLHVLFEKESDVQFQTAHIMAVSIVMLRSTHQGRRLHTSVIKATLLLVMLPAHVAMMGDGTHGHHIAKVITNGSLCN